MPRVTPLTALVLAFSGCTAGVEVGSDRAVTRLEGGVPDAAADTAPPRPCVPTACRGTLYDCGDCVDNDDDGLVDMDDPVCVGPCDNSEESFFGSIPGQNRTECVQDCYFDSNSGQGDDRCAWSHVCDVLSVAPDYPPEGPECAYDPSATVMSPGGPRRCDELEQQQSQVCVDSCVPLTPNGCDCFGCCHVEGGPAWPIWLGSRQGDAPVGTCTAEGLHDPALCRPCTQVASCLNACEECELCVGKRELPSQCPGGGPGECPTPVCPSGLTPCGTPCLPDCIPGETCLTGCCVRAPQ